MRLSKLRIDKFDNWQRKPDMPSYTGSIELLGENHKIEMRISEDIINKIVELCADSVVECAKETAEIMKADIIEGNKLLQNNS